MARRSDTAAALERIERRLERIERTLGLEGTAGAVPAIFMTPGRRHRRPPTFWYDEEVRAFVEANLWRYSVTGLAKAAEAAFGPDRAPSRSALGRYRKLRGDAARRGS